ncbi:MAG: hypothetical protein ACRC2T_03635, partial [Thermoguttaceae bacterium]
MKKYIACVSFLQLSVLLLLGTALADQAEPLKELFGRYENSDPVEANYTRHKIEVAIEKAGGVDADFLENYILDTKHAVSGRLYSLELLEKFAPDNVAKLYPALLTDPCGEMRRPAVADLIQKNELIEALKCAYDYDQVNLIVTKLAEQNTEGFNQAQARGFLTDWKVVGPFDNTESKGFATPFGPEDEAVKLEPFSEKYSGKHGEVEWKTVSSANDPLGMLQLNDILGKEKDVIAYAAAEIPERFGDNITVRASSFNALKIWVNGELVGEYEIYHGHEEPDQYTIPVKLTPEKRAILIKVCQNNQPQEYANEWRMRTRIVAEPTAIKTESENEQNPKPKNEPKSESENVSETKPANNDEKGSAPDTQPKVGETDNTPKTKATEKSNPFTGWKSFRGPLGNPVIPTVSDKLTTVLKSLDSEKPETLEKITSWKTPLPGPGPSSPIIVGDLVVVTCATGPKQEILHVIAIDKNSGKIRWERTLKATGSVLFMEFGGVAANTPVSNGRKIVVMYSSNDVACFDLDG